MTFAHSSLDPDWNNFLETFLNVFNEKFKTNIGGKDPRQKDQDFGDEEQADTPGLDLSVTIIRKKH